jgi:hypothetical protein
MPKPKRTPTDPLEQIRRLVADARDKPSSSEIEANARTLEAAVVLLRRASNQFDDDGDEGRWAKTLLSILTKVSSVERWTRRQVTDLINGMEDDAISDL